MKRIIYDYESPHIVGRAKKSLRLGRVIIFIVVVSLAVALIYILFFRKSGYKHESKEYYSVIAGYYESESQAESEAVKLRLMGGGGYIVQDDLFAVVASVYENEDDALSVAGRYGYEVESIGKYVICAEGEEDALETIELCTLPERLFDELSKTADDYDKNELSKEAVKLSLISASDKVRKAYDRIGELILHAPKDKLLLGASKMMSEIEKALDCGETFNVRYSLIRMTYLYKNFLISIS